MIEIDVYSQCVTFRLFHWLFFYETDSQLIYGHETGDRHCLAFEFLSVIVQFSSY